MPQSRNEAILENMLGADNELGAPQSRIEKLLMELLESGGGGGGGYVLKPATASKLGGIKVGENLNITDDGTLSAVGGGGYTPAEIDAMIAAIDALLVDNASKNILPAATSKTVNGITFTVADDGTVSANGTATADAFFNIAQMSIADGLVLNGCPANGSATTYFLYVQDTVTNTRLATDIGEGAEITASENQCNVNIAVRNGTTVDAVVFMPMIRRAAIEDDTYTPYYASNVALQNLLGTLSETVGNLSTSVAHIQDEVEHQFKLWDFNHTINATLPVVTSSDAAAKIDIALPSELEDDWKIASLQKYEVKNGTTRINAVPVFQFSMNQQKTLRCGFMTTGSNSESVDSIAGALLLMRRG